MKSYAMASGFDLTDVLVDGWVKPASALVDTTDYSITGWYVMDICSASDFADGHIKGAVNVELKDVVTQAPQANGQPILVVCKTGQTAGHAAMDLRLSGYSDAAVLKFGMAGWNPAFAGAWEGNIGNTAVDHQSEWTTTNPPAHEPFANPQWESTATEGEAIMAERIQLMLDNGFQSISSDDLWGNQADYQIFNFWSEADYTTLGIFPLRVC